MIASTEPTRSAEVSTPAGSERLQALEAVIQRWKDQFAEVGEALLEIKERKLYRPQYVSWIAYLKDRWALDRTHAWYLMQSALLVRELKAKGDPLPTHEAHCRPLMKVPPEKRADVWREIVEEVPVQSVTAHVVNIAVQPHVPPGRENKKGGRYPAKSLPPSMPPQRHDTRPPRTMAETVIRSEVQTYVGRVEVQQLMTVVAGEGCFWAPQVHLREFKGRWVKITVEPLT